MQAEPRPHMGGQMLRPYSPPWRRVARGAALVPLRSATGTVLRLTLLAVAAAAAAGAIALFAPSWLDVPASLRLGSSRAQPRPEQLTPGAAGPAPPATPAPSTTPEPTPMPTTSPTRAPTETPVPPTAVPPAAAPAPPPAPPGPVVHVVRRGENLTRIARDYGTTVDAIIRANRLADPNLVPEGTRLTVPR